MTENNQTRMARRNQKKKTPKKGSKSRWKKIMYTALIALVVIGLSVGALFTYYIATAPPLDPEKLEDPFSSNFYDMDEELVGNFGGVQRTKITYDDLPDVLIDAVTATEDVRFFKHNGIDLRRIAGAIKANITGGFGSQGASTITQQVVENSFLSNDKKIKLKVQEQWLALKLERKYSKEEIMEMYLNKIFYGSGAYGVASAAEEYFDKKDLNDLTLIEAAILAGLPQRPTAYNPYNSPDLMAGRVDTVLKLMVRHDKISQEEADEAREIDIASILTGKRSKASPYEAFRQQVSDEIEEKLDGVDAHTAGLKIYTTLDTNAQDYVEFVLTDSEENPVPYPDEELQVGLTVLDTKTGAIRAIGGSRNRENVEGLNYGSRVKNQPGSTFKPIVAYGPAIEYKKWSTYQQINDDKPYDEGIETPIRNWNREYQGWMSARYALANSLNVPTVKALVETGYSDAQKFGEGLGITFGDEKSNNIDIRDAIGGTKTQVSPLELGGAFRAFGNEGIYNEPYAVEKVEFPDGTVVDLRPESEAAMSDYTAYMVTDMLKSVMKEGTGTGADVPGLPVAGKTGTTNLEGGGSPDAWFAGYTTNYTISIWAGGYTNDDGGRDIIPKEVSKGIAGTQIPKFLFKDIMTELSKDIETADFVRPSSVVEVAIEKGSNPAALPSSHTPSANIVKELFVKGTEPTSVSEKFDELDPVTNLTATYDEDDDEIEISWSYDDDANVEFEVSAKVDDKGMEKLSTTDDNEFTISNIKEGSSYTIQVVVIDKDNASLKSEPVTTDVTIKEEDEDVPSVSGLDAQYNASNQLIDVQWNYDGPDATFEVSVSPTGNKQSVKGTQLEITNVQPDTTYTITVTPISKKDEVRGSPAEVSITIDPAEEENSEEEENQEEDKEEEESNEEENEEEEEVPEEGNEEEENNEEEGAEENPDNEEDNSN